jgi:hypothetical protein
MTPAQMIAAQKAAIAKLSALDGVWRGTGSMIDHPGQTPWHMTDTVRVGSALDGTVKLIELKDYLADGTVGFHALNTISYDPQKRVYVMTARGGGRSGNFSFRLTQDGYVWVIGSEARGLRYTGTIKGDTWNELGQTVAPGHDPVQMSQFTVRRIGSTDWPDGGAVPPR